MSLLPEASIALPRNDVPASEGIDLASEVFMRYEFGGGVRRFGRFSLGTAVLASALLVAGCGGGGYGGGNGGGGVMTPPEPTFTNVQTRIFSAKCAFVGCHAGANPQEGMNLSAGQAYANIVGVASTEKPEFQRVNPGNAADSYVYMKIVADPRITGARMPFGQPALSTQDRMLIADWIQAGAPNN